MIVIQGNPITKKNHMRLVKVNGRLIPIQAKAYKDYEKSALQQLSYQDLRLHGIPPFNVKCSFYMETKRKCDLINLLESVDDILVRANVLEDDNFEIIAGHDGSRVRYDKENPRVEIEITSITE